MITRAIFALVLFACLLAPAQAPAQWYDDSSTQDLILIVKKRPWLLTDGLIALERDGRVYLPIVELAELMTFYVESDPGRKYVSGWYLDPKNSFSIDAEKLEILHRGEKRQISEDDFIIDETLFGEIYVATELLNSIWPVTLAVDYSTLELIIETEEKLPFELQLERQDAQKKLAAIRASATRIDPQKLPRVENPYRFSTKPVADIQLTSTLGETLSAKSTLTGAHDILGLSAQYNISADYTDGQLKRPQNPRLSFSRRDIHGDALPFDWTEFRGGDISLQQRSLVGTSAQGRGVFISNSRFSRDTTFDTRVIEGTGPPGWEVELYRNNQLLDFGVVDDDGEYRFEDVQLMFGANRIRVVLYGTQGQIREDVQDITVGSRQLKPGEYEYSLGAVQANKDLITLRRDKSLSPEGLAYTAYSGVGINEAVSLFGSYTHLPTVEGKQAYASVGAHYSALGGVGQVETFKQLNGGTAVDLRYLTRIKNINLSARAAYFNNYESPDAGFGSNARKLELEGSASTVLPSPLGAIGLKLDTKYREQINGNTTLDIKFNQSAGIGPVRLTNNLTSQFVDKKHVSTTGRLNSTVRVKKWQFRGAANYNLSPTTEITNIQGDVRYRWDDKTNLGINVSHDLKSQLTSGGAQYARDMEKFIGSISGNWNSDGDASVTLQLSASLGPYGSNGDYVFSSERFTGRAPIKAHVFLDRDNNGYYNDGDEPIPNAGLLVGNRRTAKKTDEDGQLLALDATGGMLNAVRLDTATLDNPYYLSVSEGFGVVPRVGTMPELFFPVIETGTVDGTLTRTSDGRAIAGLDLQLVDEDGHVVSKTTTAYDGYYTFEFVPPGTYTIRAHEKYDRNAVKIAPETVVISMDELFAYGTDLEFDDGPAKVAPKSTKEQAVETQEASGGKEAAAGQVLADGGLRSASLPSGTGAVAPRSFDDGAVAHVDRVRIGEHPQKTRLVLDLSGDIQYSHTLMPDGTTIVIDLPRTAWNALADWKARTAPLLESYSVTALSSGGTRLILKTVKPVRIGYHDVIEPEKGRSGAKGYRFVMDLYPR